MQSWVLPALSDIVMVHVAPCVGVVVHSPPAMFICEPPSSVLSDKVKVCGPDGFHGAGLGVHVPHVGFMFSHLYSPCHSAILPVLSRTHKYSVLCPIGVFIVASLFVVVPPFVHVLKPLGLEFQEYLISLIPLGPVFVFMVAVLWVLYHCVDWLVALIESSELSIL